MVYMIKKVPLSILKPFRAFWVQNSSRKSNLKSPVEKSNFGVKNDQNCGGSAKAYIQGLHSCKPRLFGKRNESCIIWE